MKNILFILCLTAGAFCRLPAQSPEATSHYSVSWAPASLLYSTLDLGVERRMTTRSSLMAQGYVGFRKITLWESFAGNYVSYGGQLSYRNYFGKSAAAHNGSLWGPYAAGWVKAYTASVDVNLQQNKYNMVHSKGLTPGFELGWKFAPIRRQSNLTLDLALGAGYRFGNVSGRYAEKSRTVIFADRGFMPALSFRVAYAPGVAQAPTAKAKVAPPSAKASPEVAFHDRYSPQKRKAIEKALKRQSLFHGKADGLFDEDTIRAIKLFQQKHGLKVDGKAGKETLKRLGV